MTYRIIRDPQEDEPVLYLGIHAIRWPWESGVAPAVAFINDSEINGNLLALLETCKAQNKALETIQNLIGTEYAVCRVEGDQIVTHEIVGIDEVIEMVEKAIGTGAGQIERIEAWLDE